MKKKSVQLEILIERVKHLEGALSQLQWASHDYPSRIKIGFDERVCELRSLAKKEMDKEKKS